MKTYEFARDCNVEGKQYRAGDTVGADEVPAGSLDPMLRVGWLREYTAPPPDMPPPPPPAPAPEPAPAPKPAPAHKHKSK